MIRRSLLALGILAAFGTAAHAQSYPTKPIKLLVPFAAGGTTDLVARVVADPLSRELGQPVIVENRGGGGGAIGAAETARAPADGYNLGIATVSTTATNPAINPKIPYNVFTDFTPIVNIAATPNVIAANPKFVGKDYKSFLEEIKKNPDKYSYGTPGTGSIGHLMMEMFMLATDTKMLHVPYRGSGPAINDAVAGQIPLLFDNFPSTLPFVKEKRLTALVVAAPQRLAVLPDVPTLAEVGAPGVNRMAYYGIVGPKNLPKDIVNKVNAAVHKVLQDPAVRKRIEDTGSLIVAGTPEKFAQEIKAEYTAYKAVVDKQKLTME
ncbi:MULTISPECIES: tripartite tricarboxylate transporter substrate binding protein BugE [Comamonas]|jgi:tripartite-type tricarboxylate transporter receptor subunit TctC|uniref:Tripartite tricarboxylate transporter substrate binding protein BugE n=1 Tax=Comamonas terrigena TaxID=32013 RepID=A0A2A7UYX5_COMTR|nr:MULTISPECIES: tripartite tricarboxylate transporter substrate binding protein BugE [Comamonas]MBP7352168.1 tripartite tricarboxylate transporter substrate binding protein BugE [Comamonas sp.]MBD9532104.1 tripartite tricarboxylate transporter substrate binding protein BugE [Comamonas sp. CMM01]MBV7419974.1 tripartite tricarboxylate transporter substrate binding protein BugE [Comamonas sp. CMM03]MDH0047434.1 tripartite tricarboxylate transporter substrate binding protein BugE [Comamonas terrig